MEWRNSVNNFGRPSCRGKPCSDKKLFKGKVDKTLQPYKLRMSTLCSDELKFMSECHITLRNDLPNSINVTEHEITLGVAIWKTHVKAGHVANVL